MEATLVIVCTLLIVVDSLVAEHRLQGVWVLLVAVCWLNSCRIGSFIEAHGL